MRVSYVVRVSNVIITIIVVPMECFLLLSKKVIYGENARRFIKEIKKRVIKFLAAPWISPIIILGFFGSESFFSVTLSSFEN